MVITVFLVTGCSTWSNKNNETSGVKPLAATHEKQLECDVVATAPKIYLQQDADSTESIRVSATGYGAPPPKYYPQNQRRLMAMRAARLDAYRALAEIINGLHLWGGTTVGDMVVQQDRYRVFLDGYVRGARIVSTTPHEDGNYEIVIDMLVDQNFFNSVFNQRATAPCQDKISTMHTATTNPPMNFYYSE